MNKSVSEWGVCALLLVLTAIGVHLLSSHYGGYLQSEDINSARGIEKLGLFLLYPGFLPAMFVWPGAHHPGWWIWLEGYNILLYSLVIALVFRRLRRAKSETKAH